MRRIGYLCYDCHNLSLSYSMYYCVQRNKFMEECDFASLVRCAGFRKKYLKDYYRDRLVLISKAIMDRIKIKKGELNDMSKKTITDEVKESIINLVNNNEIVRDIANDLGVSESVVYKTIASYADAISKEVQTAATKKATIASKLYVMTLGQIKEYWKWTLSTREMPLKKPNSKDFVDNNHTEVSLSDLNSKHNPILDNISNDIANIANIYSRYNKHQVSCILSLAESMSKEKPCSDKNVNDINDCENCESRCFKSLANWKNRLEWLISSLNYIAHETTLISFREITEEMGVFMKQNNV